MWIRGFHMDGFGIFHEASCEPLKPGPTVFLGQNEAGKSTTLDFFRAMLFGFPRKNAKDRRQREPLRGGRHGGRLLLVDGNRELVLQRSPGARGGSISLLDANNVPQPEAELNRLLGSITESFFCNVYAFSLDELQMVGGDSGEILSQLYGAASGAGNALVNAEKAFDKRTGELFAPGGQKPMINQLLKQFEELEQRIREARAQSGDYASLEERLAELDAQLGEAQTTADGLAQRHRLLQSVHDYWETWVEIVDAEQALAELPEIPADTPSSPDELDTVEREMAVAQDECRQREEELAEARADIESVALDAVLLEHRDAIRALANRLPAYREARDRLPGLTAEAKNTEQALAECLRQLGPEWTREKVASCDRSLAVREQIQVHADTLTQATQGLREGEGRLSTAQAEHEQAKTRLAEAQSRGTDAKNALERMPAETCRQLRRERDELVNLTQRLPEWRQQRQELLRTSEQEAKGVDPTWTTENLADFDTSLPAQSALRESRDRLARAKSEVDLTTRDWQAAKRELEQLGAPGTAISETELQTSRGQLRELEKALLRREALSGQTGPAASPRNWLPVVGVVAVVFIVLAIVAHWAFWLGLPVVAALGYVLRPSGGTSAPTGDGSAAVREACKALGLGPDHVDLNTVQQRRDELEARFRQSQERVVAEHKYQQTETAKQAAEEALAEAEAKWQQMAKESGFSSAPSPETVLSLLPGITAAQRQLAEAGRLAERISTTEERLASTWEQVLGTGVLEHPPAEFSAEALDAFLAQYDDALRAAQEARKRVEELQSEAGSRARHVAETEAVVEKQQQALDVARQAWAEWLRERGLQESLTPDTAREALKVIQDAWQHMQRLDALDEERTRHQGTIDEVGAGADSLLASLGQLRDAEDVATIIESLAKENEENNERQVKAQERQAQAKKSEGALARAREREAEQQAALAALLDRHGAETPDDLRRRIEIAQQRLANQAVRDQGLKALRTALGTTDEGVVRDAFAKTDQALLPDELGRLSVEVTESREQQETLRNERAEVAESMKRLASSDEIAKLRQEQEAVRAEMTALATEWARATIARRLLDEAKRTFEQERQPQVLLEASKFFELLTRGRYHGVFSPLGGDRVLQALMPGQEARTPDQLSRGTVEQLYLALRFGFLTDSAAKGTCLPVIMDEILVNFDPERGKAAAKAIGQLGQSHQILYFTCHPSTAELLQQEAQANLVRVTDGAFEVV